MPNRSCLSVLTLQSVTPAMHYLYKTVHQQCTTFAKCYTSSVLPLQNSTPAVYYLYKTVHQQCTTFTKLYTLLV
jgi:hypothetical protein